MTKLCVRWCVTKWCVKDGVPKDGVTKRCVKHGVSKMVGDEVVCERWCVCDEVGWKDSVLKMV